jgi:ABC-type transport system involved in multi-copper enzyme maturation permease subunit
MIALVWKEIRELAPGALLMLLAMVVVATADAAVNSGKENPFPFSVSFAWVSTLLVASAAGASVLARERPEQLRYLNSWPISRGRVAAVKVLVAAALTAITVVALLAVAESVLALGGISFWREYRDTTMSGSLEVHAALLILLFCHTLAVSALVRSPGAALVLGPVVGFLVLLGYALLTLGPLAARYGPQLGLEWPWVTQENALLSAIDFAVLAAVAGVWGDVRTPIAERTLRLKRTVAAYVTFAAVGCVVVTGFFSVTMSGSLRDLDSIEIDHTGRTVLISTSPRGRSYHFGALWLLDPVTGRLNRIARGPMGGARLSPEGRRVLLHYGGELLDGRLEREAYWIYDIASESYERMPEPQSLRVWGDSESPEPHSPGGTYLAVDNGAFMYRRDGRWEEFVPPAPYAHGLPGGWAPDESALYWAILPNSASGTAPDALRRKAPDWNAAADTLVVRTQAPSGRTDAVGAVPGRLRVRGISPDGRYLLLGPSPYEADADSAQPPTILDLTTARGVELEGAVVSGDGWTASSERVWCRIPSSGPRHSRRRPGWVLIDASSGRHLADLRPGGDNARQLAMSADRTRILLLTQSPADTRHGFRYCLWVASADGSDCRELYQTSAKVDVTGWTSDGNVIALERDWEAGFVRVIRIDTETEAVTTLLHRPQRW